MPSQPSPCLVDAMMPGKGSLSSVVRQIARDCLVKCRGCLFGKDDNFLDQFHRLKTMSKKSAGYSDAEGKSPCVLKALWFEKN